jgi:hypothetical protein
MHHLILLVIAIFMSVYRLHAPRMNRDTGDVAKRRYSSTVVLDVPGYVFRPSAIV